MNPYVLGGIAILGPLLVWWFGTDDPDVTHGEGGGPDDPYVNP